MTVLKPHIFWSTVLLLLAAALPCSMQAAETQATKPFTVVLDAGHGGKDYGCRGKITNEKTIVLDVAKKIESLIKKEYSDSIKPILTRKDDTFIPLDERAAIANDANADLFVSIHVNSVAAKSRGREKVHGASVYTVGLHKSEANLAVAMRENGVIELEEDFTQTYQGFDPSSSESYIIFELDQNRHVAQSIEAASMIQERLVADAGRADKGVLQAGFLVLWATRMPSVLVELDFICNPAAERFLSSEDGRKKCAKAVYDAIIAYRTKFSNK